MVSLIRLNANLRLINITQRTSPLVLTKYDRPSSKEEVISASSFATVSEVKEVVSKEEVIRFISDCMVNVGVSTKDAEVVAHHLMIADYRGHFSHGMNRVPMYVGDIKKNLANPKAKPKIISDYQAIALVDGANGLGQVIGKFCMELAMEKAKKFGIGMVAARGSNHYGTAGYYTLMASEKGLIGFSCTNSSPLLVPTRATATALGTNPLSIGMKTQDDEFILDMATTAVALGKIEIAVTKKKDIPQGWALGKDDKITTDANDAYATSKLMPLGGVEENSGYKGYGLALMVELLCGILSGSTYGPNIRGWKNDPKVANLGHCFMAIDPESFAPGAEDRLNHLLFQLRSLPTTHPDHVLVPGDPERLAMRQADLDGGIHYHPNQINICNNLAEELNVVPLTVVKKSSS